MRKNPSDFGEFYRFVHDQVVHNPHAGFSHDRQFETLEMIVILMHGTGEGVLDWDDRAGDAAVFEVPEGFLAESSTLPLEGDMLSLYWFLAHFTPSQRGALGRGTPSRSSTRST